MLAAAVSDEPEPETKDCVTAPTKLAVPAPVLGVNVPPVLTWASLKFH
jgi:hypothetical protein